MVARQPILPAAGKWRAVPLRRCIDASVHANNEKGAAERCAFDAETTGAISCRRE
jgi:hypothetical protein